MLESVLKIAKTGEMAHFLLFEVPLPGMRGESAYGRVSSAQSLSDTTSTSQRCLLPVSGGKVLTSAGLGALVLSKWQGRLAIILGAILILTSIHIVVGLFACFGAWWRKMSLRSSCPTKSRWD